jgi:hypothetical protein
MSSLIDDCRTDPFAPDSPWSFFTDRVMGGVSDGRVALETVEGRSSFRMTGHVSLANRGGFIQLARSLGDGNVLDAGSFAGLELDVIGPENRYFVHLRTEETQSPWQHYSAPFRVGPVWRTVRLSWDAFAGSAIRAPLDPSRLLRLGLVAGWAEFDADLAVSRIAYYA